MDLMLSVVADPEGANMLKHTKLFTASGGSLGRADSNDWVLPDPHRVVSSQHALIEFSANQYYLVDQSTNGTYHNQSSDPLGKGNRVALNDGDVIGVGDYQLKVAVHTRPAEAAVAKGLGSADFLDSADRTTFSPAAAAKIQSREEARQLDSWLEPGAGAGPNESGEWGYLTANHATDSIDGYLGQSAPIDPLQILNTGVDPIGNTDPVAGFGKSQASASVWGGDDDWWKDGSAQDHAPASSHAMQHPAPRQPPSTQLEPTPPSQYHGVSQAPMGSPVDDNPFAASLSVMADQQVQGVPGFEHSPGGIDPARGASVLPPVGPATQAAQPQPQPQPRVGSPSHALVTNLGLNLTAEQLRTVDEQAAEIVEEAVARLIDLLRARTSIKNELRVQRTMIQVEANNPLKFSATSRDALGVMFTGNGAFMSPVEAVRDSFDDLSDHQVAVLAGMRSGYEAMLKFFNPESIERRAGNHGGVFSSRSAKNWDGFVAMYRELVSDPETCYRRLFGDEFASTYENQLSELKNARNLSGRK